MRIKGIPPISIGFLVSAKESKGKNGHNKIELSAVPSGHYFRPNAELLASIKHNKKSFTCTKELKELLKKLNWDQTALKPVIKFMKRKLDTIKHVDNETLHQKIIKVTG